MPSIDAARLLDSQLGIQSVLDMPETAGLPRARDISTGMLREAGLEELYAPQNASTAVEALLMPDVGDGTMLTPERFSRELEKAAEALNRSDDPDIRKLVDGELVTILQNEQLMQAYRNLMVAG